MTKRQGEFSIIADYFAPLAGEGTFGLRDDAALYRPKPNQIMVITQDACAESVHFFADDPPDLIAKKALRVNLSDIAAKGAEPVCFSLSLGLGKHCSESWVAEFAKGLGQDISKYEIALTGGDTFSTGSGTVISITAIGEIPHNQYVSRLGAKTGDKIFTTGTIGDAALGLQVRLGNLICKDTHKAWLLDRYLLPRPRTQFAAVIKQFATSSMDISDGLIGDLTKLCEASEVSAELYLPAVPFSEAAEACVLNESKWLETAVTGGDDYEILFTIGDENIVEFKKCLAGLDLEVTQIGEIKTGQGVSVFDSEMKRVEFAQVGYDHCGDEH